MPVFLARSECRNNFYHVVTYDISDPDNWIEIDDQPTTQPCDQVPIVVGIRRQLYKKLLQPTSLGLLAPNGDRITFTLNPNGVNVLEHVTAEGVSLQKTCSGKCGRPPRQKSVGPIPCPSGSGILDCTVDPPTLRCLPVAKGGKKGQTSKLAKKRAPRKKG